MSQPTVAPSTAIPKPLRPGLLAGLCRTYAELLRRQRTATTPFARWSKVTSRSHEFVWLGGVERREILMQGNGPLIVQKDSKLYESVKKMHATAALNPYEREVLYGYPYVIGRIDGETVRGPLLTLAIRIVAEQDRFLIHAADEVVRFNALPFQGDHETEANARAVNTVIEATPPFPLSLDNLITFSRVLAREFRCDTKSSVLDGRLDTPPKEPTASLPLTMLDQAAIFVAPKTSYFLTSDLETISKCDEALATNGSVPSLISGAGDDPQDEFTDAEIDGRTIFFPFPSNRSQRRAAVLAESSSARVIRVEGPPGTGKSLTIANLACHLAATGRTVLVTSQKDTALQVVDDKLRELGLDELPMTLLRRDRESKRELIARLESIKKERPAQEVNVAYESLAKKFHDQASAYVNEATEYATSLHWQSQVAIAHSSYMGSRGFRRLVRRVRFARTLSKSYRLSHRDTDAIADSAGARRQAVLGLAVDALRLGREKNIASATRQQRQGLRELAAVLKRDQATHKNFSLFDRLKSQPERAEMLLRMLPVWIMTPDDVARLFPCQPGLFDVVIVDEASQVDLPSITPAVFRGKKLVVFGDSKQMQPRRFAFMNIALSQQLWKQHGMTEMDPDRWLHPVEQNLLSLSTIRAEEENLLDEHFCSMPPIIQFSNERWYKGQLRIMTDERNKQFGRPDQPIIQLHHIKEARISNGSQENEEEARALVSFLSNLVTQPDYAGASIGVMCLFEEQVALLQEMIAEFIPQEEWEEHELIVINPDGFQGDERDVVLYSLSFDAVVMPRAAIAARMADQVHIQGMLNVAFTRARDEMHIFHSADTESFTFAGGRASTLSDWLEHCRQVEAAPRIARTATRVGNVDSEFEAEVSAALQGRGFRVTHQYPSCGFFIDLVAESTNSRLAIECDGERFHLDEHGELRAEDLERQAILERAGWRVVRVPYRRWLKQPELEIERIATIIADLDRIGDSEEPDLDASEVERADDNTLTATNKATGKTEDVSAWQEAILKLVLSGQSDEETILRGVRDQLGLTRLGKNVRATILVAAAQLQKRGLIAIEDREYFPTQKGRDATLRLTYSSRGSSRRRRRGYYRRRYS